MTNPVLHTIIFGAAVLIPGGLLVYFAWRAYRAHQQKKVRPEPTPVEAREAFFRKYPKDSLRAKSRNEQLNRIKVLKTRPRKKSQ